MSNRSTESQVTFKNIFSVGRQVVQQPPGSYRLVIEEELIEGVSYAAYRRVSTVLETPAVGARGNIRQFIEITSADLDAALEKDACLVSGEGALGNR